MPANIGNYHSLSITHGAVVSGAGVLGIAPKPNPNPVIAIWAWIRACNSAAFLAFSMASLARTCGAGAKGRTGAEAAAGGFWNMVKFELCYLQHDVVRQPRNHRQLFQ